MKNRELVGQFWGERNVFGEGEGRVIIGTVRDDAGETYTIKGKAADGELTTGLTYRFYGHNRRHPKYGVQFNFNSFVVEKPASPEAMKTYIRRLCGSPKNGSISPAVAEALIDRYGAKVVDQIIERPAVAFATVAEMAPRSKWTEEKCNRAREVLLGHEETRKSKVELIELLDGFGFPKATVKRAIREWGAGAAEAIRENPFLLMRLPGIGFLGADQLFTDLAKKTSKTPKEYFTRLGMIDRQAYAARHAITSQRDGSVWYPLGMARSGVKRHVAGEYAKPDEAINAAVAMEILTVIERDGREWCAVPRLARHEQQIAGSVRDLLNDPPLWPAIPESSKLSDHQREELAVATQKAIGILAGSPGCGKTFTVAAVVQAIQAEHGSAEVAIACPTGKAAVRCSEALAEEGVRGINVSTIHRLLIVQKAQGQDGWSFFHDAQEPLPQKFIIVDESSMIDVSLMAALMRAIPTGAHVLFVGDAGQLPPVGEGKPFLDLQRIVPTGKLTEIRRNSGRIVRACAEMRDEQTFTPSPSCDLESGENLPFIAVAEHQSEALERLLEQIDAQGEDVVWNTQVVCPINKNSEISRQALNEILQKRLNPHGESVKGNPFRVGDKIVCLKNGWYLSENPDDSEANEDGQVFVANGELAELLELAVGRMVVRLFQPDRTIIVPHRVYENAEREAGDDNEDRGALGDWDLGYCLSVHKSQGSQWKFVVVMIDSGGSARQVQSLNWLYTAISRASVATFCIGERKTVDEMCRRDGIGNRKTFLVEEFAEDRTEVNKVRREFSAAEMFAEV